MSGANGNDGELSSCQNGSKHSVTDKRATPEPAKSSLQLEEKVDKEEPSKWQTLRPFVIMSSSYLLYTITDGAIRMIVLLHAYNLGFSAMEVALMFTLYEVAGVGTNLLAGIAGARWGIKATLLCGLSLQLVSIAMLFGWQDDWNKVQGIVYVTFAQMLSGVSKDLTKLGGKTVTKLVTPDAKQSRLFRLVSFITGFKNSLKGAGYFLGAVVVAQSYYAALAVLMAIILAAMPWAIVGLESNLGRAKSKNVSLRDVFKMSYNINMLSAARLFLFGSRDAWFEVPLPFFLRDSIVGLGWSRSLTGLFLALFIIIYGQVQSWSPQLILQPLRQAPANKLVEVLWASLLMLVPAAMSGALLGTDVFQERQIDGMTAIMVTGLGAFCVLFAINSSVHSYLVLRYSDGDKVAMNVGFYYMSNAAGRLTGTVLSGALYSYAGSSRVDGFGYCFVLSTVFLAACVFLTQFIQDHEAGLMCGSIVCVRGQEVLADAEKGPDHVVDIPAVKKGGDGARDAGTAQNGSQNGHGNLLITAEAAVLEAAVANGANGHAPGQAFGRQDAPDEQVMPTRGAGEEGARGDAQGMGAAGASGRSGSQVAGLEGSPAGVGSASVVGGGGELPARGEEAGMGSHRVSAPGEFEVTGHGDGASASGDESDYMLAMPPAQTG